jgi:hypothetical protein
MWKSEVRVPRPGQTFPTRVSYPCHMIIIYHYTGIFRPKTAENLPRILCRGVAANQMLSDNIVISTTRPPTK